MRNTLKIGRNLSPRFSLSAFKRDTRGSVAMIFGMTAIPLMAAVGVAVDYNHITHAQASLQALADRAALAGAAREGTGQQQIQAAKDYLTNAPEASSLITYTSAVSKPTATDVKVVINATVQGTLMPVAMMLNDSSDGGAGTGDADLTPDATARVFETIGQPMCVVTLNQSASNALYIRGSGELKASGCGMFSNSNSASAAANFQGGIIARAEFFHSVGTWLISGSSGSYNHTPESGKNAISDPLNAVSVTCPSSAGAPSVSPGGSSLSPTSLGGNYTDITMNNNRYAEFTAGTHYIFGEIELKNGGTLSGTTGVTLVLCGENARVKMNGGMLQLQAPTSGPYSGYAVIGDSSATSTSTLQGGPDTFIRGAWYTPKAKLNISGNATFNSNSKYFPIVVDLLETGGTGAINIENDATFYGFPGLPNMNTETLREVYLVN